jgi:hypothetical protein
MHIMTDGEENLLYLHLHRRVCVAMEALEYILATNQRSSEYFSVEDGGDNFLRNVGSYKRHTA